MELTKLKYSNDYFDPDRFSAPRYPQDSVDYEVNLQSLYEMEKVVPMTLSERTKLRKWVRQGHDIESNPWNYSDGDGFQMNYLQAYRLVNGFSSGPWDYWRGPDEVSFWEEDSRTFVHYPDDHPEY